MANPTIQTYDDLVAAVPSWLKRQDLAAKIPIWVQFAEEYFNTRNDLVAVNARRKSFIQAAPPQAIFAVPADMQQPIQAYMGGRILDFFPIGWESSYAGGTVPKIANGWQIQGNNIVLSVPDMSLTFQLDYYQTLTGLSTSNETNWLLSASPTAYLSAVLYEGFGYARDYEKAEYWKNKRDIAVQVLIDNDISSRFPSGQLTIRAG